MLFEEEKEECLEDDKEYLEDDNGVVVSPKNVFKIKHQTYPMSISDIANYYTDGDFLIPSYQRGYVWSTKKAGLFIESILLGVPVPNVFVYKKESQFFIIDGLQRLTTINAFITGNKINQKEVKVKSQVDKWKNKRFQALDAEDKKRILRYRIQFMEIDFEKTDKEVMVQIFNRLNTGGSKLSIQHIRKAIYSDNQIIKFLYKSDDINDLCEKINLSNSKKNNEKDYELLLKIFSMNEIIKGDIFGLESKTMTKLIDDIFSKKIDPIHVQESFALIIKVINKGINKFKDCIQKSNNSLLLMEAIFNAILMEAHKNQHNDMENIENINERIYLHYRDAIEQNDKKWITSTSSVDKTFNRAQDINKVIYGK